MDALATDRARPVLARDLVALTKPRVTALNLVAAAAGLALAPGGVSPGALAATLSGLGLVIGAANGLNCWLERDSDRLMARTRDRPLPSGRLPAGAALSFCLGLAASGSALLFGAVGPLAGLLATLALLAYVLVYTPLKQHTGAALFAGALPGAAPPLIGYVAAAGQIRAPALLLFALLFFWQVPHTLAIALFRKQEYLGAGIEVLPATLGEPATRRLMAAFQVGTVGSSLLLAPEAGQVYAAVAVLCGLGSLVQAGRGLGAGCAPGWARSFFVFTNLHLAILLAVLVGERLA